MIYIHDDGRRVEIPRDIESQGGEAIAAYIEAALAATEEE